MFDDIIKTKEKIKLPYPRKIELMCGSCIYNTPLDNGVIWCSIAAGLKCALNEKEPFKKYKQKKV